MLDITAAVKSVGEAIKSIADGFKVSKEHQSETQLVKELKKLEKAVDVAEEIIEIMFKYLPLYLEQDADDLQKLVKKFRKYN